MDEGCRDDQSGKEEEALEEYIKGCRHECGSEEWNLYQALNATESAVYERWCEDEIENPGRRAL